MFKRDYIMKQIEEMVKALAVILRLRKEGKHDTAREKTDEMLHDFLQTDLATLSAIPTAQLLQELNKMNLHEDQISIVAVCFMEEGEMLEEEGREQASRDHYEKALHIFESLNRLPKPTFSLERMERIGELKRRLGV
jgi:hypothetical protein